MHLIAESLATGKPYPMLQDEPEHCAVTMLAVLESLWKARTELAKLRCDDATKNSMYGHKRPCIEVVKWPAL